MKVGFNFGAISESLVSQAKEQVLKLADGGLFDRKKEAMNLLRIHGVLSDSEYDKCCKRLMKQIEKCLVKIVSIKGEVTL